MLTVEHSGWSYIHTSFCVWNFSSGYSRMQAPKYSIWKHQISTESLFLLIVILHESTVENIIGIQALLMVIQILHELVGADIMTHRELCNPTSRESTEEFCTSFDMFASFVEQSASQLAGSSDDKAHVHPGELCTRMAAQNFPRAIQLLLVWIWIDYLKWKFKLSSTSLWRVGIKGMAPTSERRIDASDVLSILWLQVYFTDEHTQIQIHVSIGYGEGLPMLTESALSITELFLKLVKGHNSYYVR